MGDGEESAGCRPQARIKRHPVRSSHASRVTRQEGEADAWAGGGSRGRVPRSGRVGIDVSGGSARGLPFFSQKKGGRGLEEDLWREEASGVRGGGCGGARCRRASGRARRGKLGLGIPHWVKRSDGRSNGLCRSCTDALVAAGPERETNPAGLALFPGVPNPSFPLGLRLRCQGLAARRRLRIQARSRARMAAVESWAAGKTSRV